MKALTKFKDLSIKLLTGLAVVDGVCGILFMFGADGATILNNIDMTQFIQRFMGGLLLLILSWVTCFVRNVIK